MRRAKQDRHSTLDFSPSSSVMKTVVIFSCCRDTLGSGENNIKLKDSLSSSMLSFTSSMMTVCGPALDAVSVV